MDRIHAPCLRGGRDVAGSVLEVRHTLIERPYPTISRRFVSTSSRYSMTGWSDAFSSRHAVHVDPQGIDFDFGGLPKGGFSCESVMPPTVITSSSSAASNDVASNVPGLALAIVQ